MRIPTLNQILGMLAVTATLCDAETALAQNAAAPPSMKTIGTPSAAAKPEIVPSLFVLNSRGATLQGVDAQLKPGDVVDVQYQGNKAQFRIVWLGKSGTDMQGEVGVENLSAGTALWDVDPLQCATATGQS